MESDTIAVQKEENVLIRSGACSVSMLPAIGGKIASILFNGHELLQQPLAPIVPRSRSLSFDAADASGWDECLPSVAACTVSTPSGSVTIPDHGDLWRVPWTPVRQSGNSLTLSARCFSLPLTLERTVTLLDRAPGCRLALAYTLTNHGDESAPWSWAAHPLFLAEPGDRLLLPDSIHALRLEGSGNNRLGLNGASVSWPTATLAGGGSTDLSLAQPPESAIGDKLFAGPLAPAENWCAIERLSAGVRIRIGFDPQQMPYLGLWICHGGWPDGPGPKQTCFAPEPATAPVDSLAESGSWSRQLEPGASFSWNMHVDLEPLALEKI